MINKEKPKPKEECKHKKSPLSYIKWVEYADSNYARGIEQTQCPKCKLWLFPDEI